MSLNTLTVGCGRYQSLGEVTSNPVGMEGGQLVIRYKQGSTCSSGGSMSTFIILSCDNTPGAVVSHLLFVFCV